MMRLWMIAAAVAFAVLHALPAWAAVLVLAAAVLTFAVLAWWLIWRVLLRGEGVVLSWARRCPACASSL